jgi:hypothetical protein
MWQELVVHACMAADGALKRIYSCLLVWNHGVLSFFMTLS